MKIKLFTLTFIILSLTFVKAQSSDKEIKFGGRIMYDMAIWETTVGNEVTEMAGTEFRRVRLYNSGKLYGNLKYKLQLDFAEGKVSYRDVWIELGGLPLHGSLRVGHFKEPLRLEALTSSKYITFMERALPIAFSPEPCTHKRIILTSLQSILLLFSGKIRLKSAKFTLNNFHPVSSPLSN